MTISFEMEGDVGVVTMDDGKANAASAARIDELSAVLDRAEQDSDAVVLVGRPGIFCAGFDMKTMKGDDHKGCPHGASTFYLLQTCLWRISNSSTKTDG